jgi:hypothetical protein
MVPSIPESDREQDSPLSVDDLVIIDLAAENAEWRERCRSYREGFRASIHELRQGHLERESLHKRNLDLVTQNRVLVETNRGLADENRRLLEALAVNTTGDRPPHPIIRPPLPHRPATSANRAGRHVLMTVNRDATEGLRDGAQ